MIYLSVFLFVAAAFFGFQAFKSGSPDGRYFAICLLIAAIGSLLVAFISYGAMQAL